MMKIGITGSISSGKTTATRIISFKRGPVFSADKIVKNLYKIWDVEDDFYFHCIQPCSATLHCTVPNLGRAGGQNKLGI